MRYQILILDHPNDFYRMLKLKFNETDIKFTVPRSIQEAASLCAEQTFHLIILRFADFTLCSKFFIALRQINFAPAIALVDEYDADNACDVLQSGADLCVKTDWPLGLTVDHIIAQFRRYVAYNQRENQQMGKDTAFQVGDIFIDPARRKVKVCGQPINLRPREFSLLLYFMQNPDIVLTADQICEHAWGMEYTQPVGQSVHELRKQIESKTGQSCYIQTIYRVGYRFTAHSSETCDD